MKYLAIILARGGSKSIPYKNLKELNGLPLIAHSINLALDCNIFDDVIVSSDSEEILSISKNFGASIIKRPIEFAEDNSTSESAIIHALHELKKEGKSRSIYRLIWTLYPI